MNFRSTNKRKTNLLGLASQRSASPILHKRIYTQFPWDMNIKSVKGAQGKNFLLPYKMGNTFHHCAAGGFPRVASILGKFSDIFLNFI